MWTRWTEKANKDAGVDVGKEVGEARVSMEEVGEEEGEAGSSG